MVYFPQDETGKMRKLSQPWHGPYRITSRDDPDVMVTKIYFPDDPPIQVHQTRIQRCPMSFPPGFYWYGAKRSKPGRPPKQVLKQLANMEAEIKRFSPETALELATTEDVLSQKPEIGNGKSTVEMSQETSQTDIPPEEIDNQQLNTDSPKSMTMTAENKTYKQPPYVCPYALRSRKKKETLGTSLIRQGSNVRRDLF